MTAPQGYDEAVRLVTQATSRRAQYLAHMRTFVKGQQYAGRKSFWDDSVPLQERAPCIVVPVVGKAITDLSDLAMGEGRFPTAKAESQELDAALAKVAKQARLEAAAGDLLEAAMGQASAAAVAAVRGGRLVVDVVRADWCTPTLGREGECAKLTIEYPYIDERKVGGESRSVAMMYRRVIDEKADTTYLPVELRDGATNYEWKVDASQTVAHGLGFCPVVWYPFMRGCSIVGSVDGHAIHEDVTDEIEAHDFTISQRHRAALYAGDPQWTEVGVDAGYNPSEAGRAPRVLAKSSPAGGEVTAANPAHRGGYIDPRPGRGKIRRKGPGNVWQYEKADVKVQLHTLPGDALKALDDDARDLRLKIGDALGVVILDPTTMPKASTMSGRFVESFKRPMYARCDKIRVDFGDRGLVPLWAMLLRIALVKSLVSGVAMPTWQSWHAAPIDLMWGSYRTPEPEEKLFEVRTANEAKKGGLATTKAAVTMIRHILGVEDVDGYLKELAAEREQEAARAKAQATQLTAAEGDQNNATAGDGENATDTEETDA